MPKGWRRYISNWLRCLNGPLRQAIAECDDAGRAPEVLRQANDPTERNLSQLVYGSLPIIELLVWHSLQKYFDQIGHLLGLHTYGDRSDLLIVAHN